MTKTRTGRIGQLRREFVLIAMRTPIVSTVAAFNKLDPPKTKGPKWCYIAVHGIEANSMSAPATADNVILTCMEDEDSNGL